MQPYRTSTAALAAEKEKSGGGPSSAPTQISSLVANHISATPVTPNKGTPTSLDGGRGAASTPRAAPGSAPGTPRGAGVGGGTAGGAAGTPRGPGSPFFGPGTPLMGLASGMGTSGMLGAPVLPGAPGMLSPRAGAQLVGAASTPVRRGGGGAAFNFGADAVRTARRHGAALFFGVSAVPSPGQVTGHHPHGPDSMASSAVSGMHTPMGSPMMSTPGAGLGRTSSPGAAGGDGSGDKAADSGLVQIAGIANRDLGRKKKRLTDIVDIRVEARNGGKTKIKTKYLEDYNLLESTFMTASILILLSGIMFKSAELDAK
jgi:hypothetical protein